MFLSKLKLFYSNTTNFPPIFHFQLQLSHPSPLMPGHTSQAPSAWAGSSISKFATGPTLDRLSGVLDVVVVAT